jgi:DNA-binding transcriptional ArsR family regulator
METFALPDADRPTGLAQAARLFGVLSEPARLRILQLLGDGSLCGRELAKNLNLTPATTCHHLDKLKLANLLSERRSGKHVYYSIADGELARAVSQSLEVLESSALNEDDRSAREASTLEKKQGRKNRKKTNDTHACG